MENSSLVYERIRIFQFKGLKYLNSLAEISWIWAGLGVGFVSLWFWCSLSDSKCYFLGKFFLKEILLKKEIKKW